MLDDDTVINRAFKPVIDTKGISTINESAVIYENELFNRLNETEFNTIADIVSDDTNYKLLISETDENDSSTRLKYSRALGIKRLAIGVQRMLDKTFKELFR
ncbi:hypothetical protein PCI56_04295 [Plesiomonas shigelloides subsp. oncorhynchi]|nr:hypothetical protein [Plesiomonas shigelloides]